MFYQKFIGYTVQCCTAKKMFSLQALASLAGAALLTANAINNDYNQDQTGAMIAASLLTLNGIVSGLVACALKPQLEQSDEEQGINNDHKAPTYNSIYPLHLKMRVTQTSIFESYH